jgi:hypothetical protein
MNLVRTEPDNGVPRNAVRQNGWERPRQGIPPLSPYPLRVPGDRVVPSFPPVKAAARWLPPPSAAASPLFAQRQSTGE